MVWLLPSSSYARYSQDLGWISGPLCDMKKVNLTGLHAVWFHLYNILQTIKLKNRSVLPGVRSAGSRGVGGYGSAAEGTLVMLPSLHRLFSSETFPHATDLLCSFFFFLIEIHLIYNIVFISGVQESDSVIYTYMYSFSYSFSLWFITGYRI